MELEAIAALEDVAARALPAEHVADIGGWLARRTPGLATKRANSVLAHAPDGTLPLPDMLAAAERFYHAVGRPPRFALCPASRPDGLGGLLRARGYRESPPTAVQVGGLALAAQLGPMPGASVVLEPVPGPGWWETWATAIAVDRRRLRAVVAVFQRVCAAMTFATVSVGAQRTPVATGLAVRDGRWLGIFNMATLPAHRGRRAARAALAADAATVTAMPPAGPTERRA